MSGSNYYFLTCIQISQEAGKVIWYSHLFTNLQNTVLLASSSYPTHVFEIGIITVIQLSSSIQSVVAVSFMG